MFSEARDVFSEARDRFSEGRNGFSEGRNGFSEGRGGFSEGSDRIFCGRFLAIPYCRRYWEGIVRRHWRCSPEA